MLLALFVPVAALADTPPVLTLDDAIRIAVARHPNLEAARAQLQAARARVEEARAGFFPSATGSLTYNPQTANFAPTPGFQRALQRPSTVGTDTVADTAGNTITAQCGIMRPGDPTDPCKPQPPAPPLPTSYALANYWTAGLGVSYYAFEWGRTFYGFRAAGKNADAQRFTVRATRDDVVYAVKLAFYNALAAQEGVEVSLEAVATQRRHADQARAFYQVGARTRIDVASAESDVASAELTLARARGSLDSSLAALASALGEETWHPWQLIAPPAPVEAPLPAGAQVLDEAVRSRPEVHDLELRARAFEDTRRSLRASYLPSLLLQAGPSWAGTDFTALTTNFNLALSLTYPLGGVNPYLVASQVHEAEANRVATEAQARAVRNQVRLDAANALAQLSSAREAVVAARKLLAAARDRRDLAEGRYQAGVGSIIELSDAQLAFVNARFQEVNAVFSLLEAQAALDRALGHADGS